jgi:hypothetical protein
MTGCSLIAHQCSNEANNILHRHSDLLAGIPLTNLRTNLTVKAARGTRRVLTSDAGQGGCLSLRRDAHARAHNSAETDRDTGVRGMLEVDGNGKWHADFVISRIAAPNSSCGLVHPAADARGAELPVELRDRCRKQRALRESCNETFERSDDGREP